ncbi:hypothetical protein HYW82_03975 [Candidatus Peregrinibacteria bacterium]|nr:hypothetical protein [Candidatus Peregrinibacteria bacterium]
MPVDFDPLYPLPERPAYLPLLGVLGAEMSQKLYQVRDALAAAIPGFPNTRCVEAATFVASELGLPRVS